jgi:hypothetical protein
MIEAELLIHRTPKVFKSLAFAFDGYAPQRGDNITCICPARQKNRPY